MTAMVDDAGRLRALTDLASCLLVEAAAGTGKTSLLAGRVVMLLAAGVDPKSIAAITFTELAAGELRQRIAWYLDFILADKVPDELRLSLPDGPTPDQREALRAASDRLDELNCGTIHGFCHDLLRTYSVEAAIDPGAEVLDADQADFAFDAIFDRWWRTRLDKPVSSPGDCVASIARGDPTGAEDLLRSFARFRYRLAQPLPSDLDLKADLEFAENVREFRRWCDHVDVPPEADPDIVALEALALHFQGRFDPLPDFEALWELAHPAWLPIMRKDAFDLRDYRRRSLWRKVAGREAGDVLADQAEEHYARCRNAYGTLMGRIRSDTTPIQIFNRATDPFLPGVKDHLFATLELLDQRGLKNSVLVITRWKIEPGDIARLEWLKNLRLTILVTWSGIDDVRVEPVDSAHAENSLRVLHDHASKTKAILYWRPLIGGLNDTNNHISRALALSEYADATVFTGLFHRAEIRAHLREAGVADLYPEIARRKILPAEIERGVTKAFVGKALFRKTSCGVAYAHAIADYNGHFGIREICDICPQQQVDRCAATHVKPEVSRVKELATLAKLETNHISIDERRIELSGSTEQQRYFIQHTLNYQVHDRSHPHLRGRHGRAEVGWE